VRAQRGEATEGLRRARRNQQIRRGKSGTRFSALSQEPKRARTDHKERLVRVNLPMILQQRNRPFLHNIRLASPDPVRTPKTQTRQRKKTHYRSYCFGFAPFRLKTGLFSWSVQKSRVSRRPVQSPQTRTDGGHHQAVDGIPARGNKRVVHHAVAVHLDRTEPSAS